MSSVDSAAVANNGTLSYERLKKLTTNCKEIAAKYNIKIIIPQSTYCPYKPPPVADNRKFIIIDYLSMVHPAGSIKNNGGV